MWNLKHNAICFAKLALRKLNPVLQLNRLHPDACVSFSAWGEDRVVASWLQFNGISASQVSYLDIGASSPSILSNTFYFYLKGGRGVLVEPDPDLVAALRSNRPRDLVLEMGVTHDDRKQAQLIRLSSRVFNTISPDHADQTLEQSKKWPSDQRQNVVDVIDVRLSNINDIIDEHYGGEAPHFLSMDVEGLDFKILQSLDLTRYRPVVICTEINVALEDYLSLLSPFRYKLVCTTPDNYIFVREGGV